MIDNQNLEVKEEVTVEPQETMADYAAELEASFRKIKEGDILTGTVLAVNEEEVILDLNYYAQGIIKVGDLSNDPDFNPLQEIEIGSVIKATVVSEDDGQGNIVLSKKEANDLLAWDKLAEYMSNQTELIVRVKEAVNAGVVAFVEGIRGFIPASQLALEYIEDTTPFIGKELPVKIITVDKEKEKLVFSHKVVAKEKESQEAKHKISMLVPGSVVEGTVETLMPYGAFINLGNGLSGLVHISQICTRRIKKPSEVLKEGETVKAKILNTNDNKISLSIKAVEEEAQMEDLSEIEAYQYHSEGEATTTLGDLFAKLKL